MHAVSHSLAQRGAARNGARWHPYLSPRSAGGSSRSSHYADFSDPSFSIHSNYLNTPAASVSSVSPQSSSSVSSQSDSPPVNIPPSQRAKFVVGLVDQAVKSLSEIWQPRYIPTVFSSPTRLVQSTTVIGASDVLRPSRSPMTFSLRNTQLPSPCSPSTHQSPVTLKPQPEYYVPIDTLPNVSGTASELVPLKGFVHEVLRRSRTSGSVLQTALCYIEAVRTKLPGLLEQEARGEGVQGEPEMESRIVLGEDDSELIEQLDISSIIDINNCAPTEDPTTTSCGDLCLDPEAAPSSSFITGAPAPSSGITAVAPGAFGKKRKTPSAPLAPLPPLPSPLLCPRRTFLASLILASKFTQDRCYSNRAWAKLSGLPAREIGRCERALGEALEWRLWVGKATHTTTAVSTQSEMSSNRVVTRCKSEGDLMAGARIFDTSLGMASPPDSDAGDSPELSRPRTAPHGPSGLSRCSTLPAFTNYPTPSSMSTFNYTLPSTGPELLTSRPYAYVSCDDGIQADTANYVESSPSTASTPTLVFSPASLGERTIQMSQMSAFSDVPTPVHTSFPTFCTGKDEPISMFDAATMVRDDIWTF